MITENFSKRERKLFLLEIMRLFNLKKDDIRKVKDTIYMFKYDNISCRLELTPPNSYEIWDAKLTRFIEDDFGRKLIDTLIFEIKVRDTHFEDFIIELDKTKSLFAKVDSENEKGRKAQLVYLVISPNGSYYFNIDRERLLCPSLWTKIYMNKSTAVSRDKKWQKWVSYISCDDAFLLGPTKNDIKLW